MLHNKRIANQFGLRWFEHAASLLWERKLIPAEYGQWAVYRCRPECGGFDKKLNKRSWDTPWWECPECVTSFWPATIEGVLNAAREEFDKRDNYWHWLIAEQLATPEEFREIWGEEYSGDRRRKELEARAAARLRPRRRSGRVCEFCGESLNERAAGWSDTQYPGGGEYRYCSACGADTGYAAEPEEIARWTSR